jgi:Large eukaryotic DNA virus major capsid protein/Major capsid protein N-terminus
MYISRLYSLTYSMNAAQAALNANIPLDTFTSGAINPFDSLIAQHTPFNITQRSISLNGINGYLGQKITVNLKPRDCKDLFTNMYIKFSLPKGYDYTPRLGRAIISEVDFIVGNTTIQSNTDDWYVLHDELFLGADEQLGIDYAVNGNNGQYIVPLEFFFCQKGHNFPVCAIDTDTITIAIYFNNQSWITNTPDTIDLIDPYLIIEEVTLGIEERLKLRMNPIKLLVPLAYKEGVVEYVGNSAQIHMSAPYNVTMMIWFIRNKLYESGDARYYPYRYSYGYTSQYINASVPVTFFNGSTYNYIDTLSTTTIWLNKHNLLKFNPDGLYHSVKQPVDHGLSLPTKNMYMYCFTEKPSEFDTSGSINFAKYDYATTYIDIAFNAAYAPEIESNYSLNMYYYGYIPLKIQNGFCGF